MERSTAISSQFSSLSLIDTHCHLEIDAFDPDREAVIQRAKDAGIAALITIGSDMAGNIGGLDLAEKYDFIYSSVGFHPHDAKDFTEEIFKKIKGWVTSRYSALTKDMPPANLPLDKEIGPLGKGGMGGGKVVAIGEIGLDYHYDNSPRDIQRQVFRKQLHLAKEINLPVIIHSREAQKDTLDIVKESGIKKGVFHCFSGDLEMAKKVIAMGFHISIAGPVTFRKSLTLQEVAKAVPDEYLLIETDAPYLTPEPYRGRRNEPAYIVHTAQAIAKIRNVTLEDIARITTLNARRLFHIGKMPETGEIAYKIRDSLYLNITNRCTNRCAFCIRFHSDYVKGHNLRLSHEPTEEEVIQAIEDPAQYREIVFCGYGEPMLRLDLIKNVARWIKQHGGKVRINTNGHGNLIHKRNILPELQGIVDRISISLDAQDEETYNRICKPDFGNAYHEVLNFIREAKKVIPDVSVTVVTAKGIDIEQCRRTAGKLGVGFRVRNLDIVG
ncbi:MAG: TatD family nuclease-associated radical SAM protein [Thermodesulfovibrionales bacterium]|nr:TatD family nuclease-associated radical SAM protein [Thermodesulfovibrionales bacterium]